MRSRECSYIYVDNALVSVVIHLQHKDIGMDPRRVHAKLTSCDSVELPHPSIKIRTFLSGMSSRRMSATSAYVLNQSYDASSDSLRSQLDFSLPNSNKTISLVIPLVPAPFVFEKMPDWKS